MPADHSKENWSEISMEADQLPHTGPVLNQFILKTLVRTASVAELRSCVKVEVAVLGSCP